MPTRFSYYDKLSAARKKIYRESDAVTSLALREPEAIRPLVAALRTALDGGKRSVVQAGSAALIDALCVDAAIPGVKVQVLAARPRNDYGELHGLYTWDPPAKALIQLWMRTAAHRRVVAWKSFLRTLLHEFGHHADYQLLELGDSFHTQGFYSRESSLFHQLSSDEAPTAGQAPRSKKPARSTAAPVDESPRAATGRDPKKKTPRKTPPTKTPARKTPRAIAQLGLPGFD